MYQGPIMCKVLFQVQEKWRLESKKQVFKDHGLVK